MRILVTGANGFIGSHVAAALESGGHTVLRGVRAGTGVSPPGRIACDFARDLEPGDWLPRLDGVEAVVNCAGILRETGQATFDRVHRVAPVALFAACEQVGVDKVVQISAIGDAADTAFVASKHEGDKALMATSLDWTVVRPSLVWSPAGSYGGTSLLRAMAALPWVLFVPGTGSRNSLQMAPITAEDLAAAVVGIIDRTKPIRRVVEAVGPEHMDLATFLVNLRQWLKLRPVRIAKLPGAAVRFGAALGQIFGSGPLGRAMYKMLMRGNVGADDAFETLEALSGHRPISVSEALARHPSHVQDRWHARLYFLGPVLRLCLAAVWIVSGIAGFAMISSAFLSEVPTLGMDSETHRLAIWSTSILDILVGAAALFARFVRPAGLAMLVMVLGYTFVVGLEAPELWLAPLGGLVKNLALIPAILVMMVLAERR